MTDSPRPNPDELLKRIRHEESEGARARLKIFFGASAGVGKTFAMLEEAHERKRSGIDVVVGIVETHGRAETAALLDGLEMLPRKRLEHRAASIEEFDLDEALARKPRLLLLDELAHSNAPGSRHAKRWQDVEELLAAGIDVDTTLNVQHVESLIDIVAQITGVTVRETVPDSIIDRADEIEIVDLPPDDLLQRLREGKVYLPEQARQAQDNFFRKGNLIALRELALRRTARRVDAQMDIYRKAEGLVRSWPVNERILVAIGDPSVGLRLVRAARTMSDALRAEWIVAYVETPALLRENAGIRDHIVDVMGLAEELGAECAMLSGLRVSDELLAFARARNVTRIVVGKPTRPRWLEAVSGSLVSALVRDSREIDVFVIRGEDTRVADPEPRPQPARVDPRSYAGALAIVAVASLAAWAMRPAFDESNLVMVYLLGVVVSAVAFGRWPAILAAVLSVAVFDFCFVPPYFTFAVSDTQYGVTFAVMLSVALVIGTLAARLRDQAHAARQRELRTAALFQLSRELSASSDPQQVIGVAVHRVGDVFDCAVAVLLPGEAGRLAPAAGDLDLFGGPGHELGVAQWAFDHAQPAGLETDTLPASRGLYIPLTGTRESLGILGVSPRHSGAIRDPSRFRLLQTFADQTALALERAQLAAREELARSAVETERLRNALLSSVSHDLRTPLAVITGAASSLRSEQSASSPAERRELLDTIFEEAGRLNRLVGNLLDMTRLESGGVTVNRGWHSLEEIVGSTLARLEPAIGSRVVDVQLPPEMPLVPLDELMLEQVLFNLVDNALKYSPSSTPIELSARLRKRVPFHGNSTKDERPDALIIEVGDHGRGFEPGEETRVFEKFYRGSDAGAQRGSGLGLTICHGIIAAHGGSLTAANRPGGGAIMTVTLPIAGDPPRVEDEESASALDAPLGTS